MARVRRRTAFAAGPDGETARLVGPHFDRAFYLARNRDVAAAGADPLAHFLSYGWREGRDPAANFSIADYLELNPDVAAAGGNPFVHYLRAGRDEGREAKRTLGYRHDILAGLTPLSQRLAPPKGRGPQAGATAELAQALAISRSGLAQVHLSLSHDDFTTNLGGVQLCLQREAAGLAARGVDHLHLFPAQAYPIVRVTGGLLGLIWNGTLVGYFPAAAVAEAVGPALAAAEGRSLAVHSLLGHAVDDVLAITRAAGIGEGLFWLHDFASLCAGFHLMRNDVADCAAPPPQSAACGICHYGPFRAGHMAAHRRLFEALDLTVISPSQSALDLWLAAGALPHRAATVRPHASFGAANSDVAAPDPGPLRVAFAGLPTAHKGWPVFQDLALKFRDDPRYRFVQLGRQGPQDLDLEFHPAAVSPEAPAAMRDALAAAQIDVAVIWPLCRETFSFTAHEAAAAGAAVLTHPDSGAVAALAATEGRVLADEAALTALFESGEVLTLSRAARGAVPRELVFGALSAELRDGPAAKPKRRRAKVAEA